MGSSEACFRMGTASTVDRQPACESSHIAASILWHQPANQTVYQRPALLADAEDLAGRHLRARDQESQVPELVRGAK